MAEEETVVVTLKGTYGYFNSHTGRKQNWGPGKNIAVPVGLARSLGLMPVKGTPVAVAADSSASATPVDDPTVLGLRPQVLDALVAAGFTSLDSIAAATEDDLVAVKGVGVQTAGRIKALAQEQLDNGTN